MKNTDWIFEVVDSFYQKAKVDILIGYHFRNIKDFDEHIPRIAAFWELQLLGTTQRKLHTPFDVINVHAPLNIKRGELGRWMLLFKESLQAKVNEHEEFQELSELWLVRLKFFEGVFSRSFGI